jgi:Ni,Fe-hydrogenase III large subunit
MTFPLGPYHPALLEPMNLRLALRGETVTGVDIHTGYVRRDIPSMINKRNLEEALTLIEHACGTCGYSHRLAFCLALEQSAGITPPPRARALRTAFAEIERVLSRLWYLMQIGRASEIGTIFSGALEAREMLFDACVSAVGTRMFWEVAVPGGITEISDPDALIEAVSDVENRLMALDSLLIPTGMLMRRMKGRGVISSDTVADLGLTGLLARATGTTADMRSTDAYEYYDQIADILTSEEANPTDLNGDVASRVQLALADLHTSLNCIVEIVTDLPDGQGHEPFPTILVPATISSQIEGPHGQEHISLELGANSTGGQRTDPSQSGWISVCTLTTPSSANIGIVPIILNGTSLNEVPLILASLDICVACVDM